MCMNSLASGQSLPAGLSYDHVCVRVCVYVVSSSLVCIMMHDNTCQGFMN